MINDEALAATQTPSDGKTADLDLLLELAEVLDDLRRLRQDTATASAELRHGRSRVVHLEALLRANSIARAALRKAGTADRVSAEILDDAISGARRAYASANDGAASGSETLVPLLDRLSKGTIALERRAEEIRAMLSTSTRRLFDAVERRHISPPIATLADRACGQCNVRVPTALANAVISDTTLHICPHCKRILVPARSSELPSAVS